MNTSISVVLPCYNEEKNIVSVVNKVLDFLPNEFKDFEVILVNDGSRDETGNIVELLSKSHNFITVINHPVNRGYGAALKSGFKKANKELIFYMDSDDQFDINELTKLTPLIEYNDIVTGFRINRRDAFLRKLNAFLWGKLANILFRFNIADINCAFKLYKRQVIKEMKIESEGAFINTEIFAKARNKKYRIAEVGVNHYPRKQGNQTGANIFVVFKAFVELFKLYQELK